MGTSTAARERFTRLYEQHYWAVVRYLQRRLRDQDAARDAAAEVFTITWRRLHDVPDEALPWLYATARNVLANSQRSRNRRLRLHRRLAAEPPVGEPASNGYEQVHAALASLSDADQEILRLAAWEDLKPAQIAEALGCTANAASVRLHRARERFGTALRDVDRSETMEVSSDR
ncbi:RNA polymerase sigma factor [Knoellia sp. p5-6-4]|uniref:RNA polymerase sigma factor n=1 Tax=unclassified Knoellia TaxID=2618719 RepID=UPI0023DA1F7A|nr:sigma-70 family RNA polymerase sigma factor [Knoellia sp. p5-6-4]MDF2146951.1 sigma-70 family RNA polymerase sigma factor [Knoellia sp. p5-6-4]